MTFCIDILDSERGLSCSSNPRPSSRSPSSWTKFFVSVTCTVLWLYYAPGELASPAVWSFVCIRKTGEATHSKTNIKRTLLPSSFFFFFLVHTHFLLVWFSFVFYSHPRLSILRYSPSPYLIFPIPPTLPHLILSIPLNSFSLSTSSFSSASSLITSPS